MFLIDDLENTMEESNKELSSRLDKIGEIISFKKFSNFLKLPFKNIVILLFLVLTLI